MILACYAKMHPLTRAALIKYAPDTTYVDVSGDDEALWRTFAACWTGFGPLVIIQQDVEITAEVLPSLASCSEPWCTFCHEGSSPESDTGFGCGRFSAEAQRLVTTETMKATPFQYCYLHKSNSAGCMCWVHMDASVFNAFDAIGIRPHVHGSLRHLKHVPWPD